MAQNISARFDDALVARVDRLAAAYGTTRSKIIAWATGEHIATVYDQIDELEATDATRPPGIPV